MKFSWATPYPHSCYRRGNICLLDGGGELSVSRVSPIKIVGSRVRFLLYSQEPGHCHPCGPGQPGQQPLPQVPQHRAENCHELAADGPQCSSQRLCPGSFQRLPEYHRAIAGNAWCWQKRSLTWPKAVPHTEVPPEARENPGLATVWWVDSQMQWCLWG